MSHAWVGEGQGREPVRRNGVAGSSDWPRWKAKSTSRRAIDAGSGVAFFNYFRAEILTDSEAHAVGPEPVLFRDRERVEADPAVISRQFEAQPARKA